MEKNYVISVFTENKVGLLNRLTIIFTRRQMNIESIIASESEVEGIHRFTIVVHATAEQVEKVVRQIEKHVEVMKGFYHEEEQVVHQELALFKIRNGVFTGGSLERIVRENHARVLEVDSDYIIIEKTGHKTEIQTLFGLFEANNGLVEFARSGTVAVTRMHDNFTQYLHEFEGMEQGKL